jgi:hypothetical protein
MPFNRVLAVVIDDPSDINTVSRAADIVRDDHGRLYIIYVIKIQRSLPLDAEIEDQIARGEQVLHRSERLARLPRSDIDSQLLQALIQRITVLFHSETISHTYSNTLHVM